MPTVTLPDWWVLVAPCGCVDGIRRAVVEGVVITPTAEAAWEKFSPMKRERERERRSGWICRAGDATDLAATKIPCSHGTGGL